MQAVWNLCASGSAAGSILHCLFNQFIHQIFLRHTQMLHQLRIHADIGKARQCVDLIQNNAAVLCQEEVYTGQPLAAQHCIGANCCFPDPVRICIRNPCRNIKLGSAVYVFIVIVIEIRSRFDFSHIGSNRCIITEYSNLQFSSVNEFLNDYLFIMCKGNLKGVIQRYQVISLVYADR